MGPTTSIRILIERTGTSLVVLWLTLTGSLGLAALGQTTTRQVPVDSLIYDLKNPDPVRRKDAARALGDAKIQRATPDLVAAAGDADATVRREVAVALDKMYDIRALPAFVKLSEDPEKDIRERCIRAITGLYLPQETGLVPTITKLGNFFNPWSDEWADVIVEPGIRVDASAVVALRGRLRDSDDGIRLQAARSLGILRAGEAGSALVESLREDKSNAVRFEAARALRKIGNPSAGPDLMSFLNYGDAKVRNEVVYTLGRLRYREAVPELTRIFNKEAALPRKQRDATYVDRLIDALAFIADPSSKELFVTETRNPEDAIRLRAFEGLARIGDSAQVSDVSRDRLREKSPAIRTAQAYALYRMGRKEYIEELGKAIESSKTSQGARQYLAEFRPDEVPDLYNLAKSENTPVREAVAEALGYVGDSGALPVLQELSKDGRGQIASLSNQAIRRINARSQGNER